MAKQTWYKQLSGSFTSGNSYNIARHSSPNCTHSYTLHVQYKPPIVPTQTANSGIKNHVSDSAQKKSELNVRPQLSGLQWGHTQHNNRAAAGGYEVNK